MKIAIAGTGNVSQYLTEEISAYGHDVVVLTRSKKPGSKFEQRETDYSVPSLISALEDCDALVSTVSDYEKPASAIKSHLNMLEALQQSGRCKSFIPSEWTLNVEDHPEQPMFLAESQGILHGALKGQTDVKWTIISNSWFMDYVNPVQNRHLRDIGPIWPMDHQNKTFTIYGPGTQVIDTTSARDVAKAVAALLASKKPWEPYTYISAQQLTWNDLFAIIKKRDAAWKSRTKPLADTVNQIVRNESPLSALVAMFEIESYAGALQLPAEKVQKHREKYFQGVHFRTVEELLDAASANPDTIV